MRFVNMICSSKQSISSNAAARSTAHLDDSEINESELFGDSSNCIIFKYIIPAMIRYKFMISESSKPNVENALFSCRYLSERESYCGTSYNVHIYI